MIDAIEFYQETHARDDDAVWHKIPNGTVTSTTVSNDITASLKEESNQQQQQQQQPSTRKTDGFASIGKSWRRLSKIATGDSKNKVRIKDDMLQVGTNMLAYRMPLQKAWSSRKRRKRRYHQRKDHYHKPIHNPRKHL